MRAVSGACARRFRALPPLSQHSTRESRKTACKLVFQPGQAGFKCFLGALQLIRVGDPLAALLNTSLVRLGDLLDQFKPTTFRKQADDPQGCHGGGIDK